MDEIDPTLWEDMADALETFANTAPWEARPDIAFHPVINAARRMPLGAQRSAIGSLCLSHNTPAAVAYQARALATQLRCEALLKTEPHASEYFMGEAMNIVSNSMPPAGQPANKC